MKRILSGAAMLLMLSCGAAFAGHGKVGLWNVSTTMNMAASLPPSVLAQMKKAGMKDPTNQTMVSQVCMTQAEVDSDKSPEMKKNDAGCQTHMVSQTGSSMHMEMVCDGKMKGKGQIMINYNGAEHYTGSYAFSGNVEGSTSTMLSTMKGDWVKADCGAIKPGQAK